MTYDTLITDAKKEIPGFNHEFQRLVSEGEIDLETGPHIVFSFVFNPIAIDAIKTGNEEDTKIIFDFIEQMSQSEDRRVNEVCAFTVLEEIHDEIPDETLYTLMGESTKEDFSYLTIYMKSNSQTKSE